MLHTVSSPSVEAPRASPRLRVPTGIFLVVGAVYVLSSPGRIDMIDGQLRYEVAQSLSDEGRPVIRDRALKYSGVHGRGGAIYCNYGLAGSLAGMPLVMLGSFTDDPRGEMRRFLFSLASPILGGLTAALFYWFYLELGVSLRAALAWTFVSSFCTLLWPLSTSSFDNAQHAFFLLLAVFLAHRSAVRRSPFLALLGGLAAGVLILYRDYFILLIPALALSTLAHASDAKADIRTTLPRPRQGLRATFLQARDALRSAGRPAQARFLVFIGGAGLGLAISLSYNFYRFGSIFALGNTLLQQKVGIPLFGDPVAGLLTLLVSPGKSVLLYSPPILLGFAGIRALWKGRPYLGCAIVSASVVLITFLAQISFVGGDWCWGPRYLVPLLPLWALAFPFIPVRSVRRWLVVAIVGAGLAIQVLALAVDHQRFFFDLALPDFFWADDSWFYFKQSALLSRPGEIASMMDGPPLTAQRFAPGPYRDLVTYCIFGNPMSQRALAPRWMRQFQVFYLPRPWPLWMPVIEPGRQPINPKLWTAACLVAAGLGLVCIYSRSRAVPGGGRFARGCELPGALSPPCSGPV